MQLIPIVSTFVIALIGALAVGLRPGYPFGALLLGATIVAAMTGISASVLQFLPPRQYLPAAIAVGTALGLLVAPMLRATELLGFGDVRGVASAVWPVAAVSGLLLSRASGMQIPLPRRRRATVHRS